MSATEISGGEERFLRGVRASTVNIGVLKSDDHHRETRW